MKHKQCSFCSEEESAYNFIIAGKCTGGICSNCIAAGYALLFGDIKPSEIDTVRTGNKVDFFEDIRKPKDIQHNLKEGSII